MILMRDAKHKTSLIIVFGIVLMLGIVLLFNWRVRNGEEGTIGEVWGTIYGTVLLGPTCPVMRDPPDPQCADKPFATSLSITTPDGARVVKTFTSDSAGKFSVKVSPGEYSIRSAATANIRPYCQSNSQFQVTVNGTVEVQVSCDTGIR